MKKISTFAIGCVLALGLVAPSASAVTLTTSSAEYLGLIDPALPASIAAEAGYINTLLAQPLDSGPTSIGGQEYTRSNNDCPDCPTAVATGAFKVEALKVNGVDNVNQIHLGIDVTGWTYLLAKYDGPNYGSVVFYVGGLSGPIDLLEFLPENERPNYQISHYTLFNNVPDGGMTLMLLGGALIGLEGLRRRLRV